MLRITPAKFRLMKSSLMSLMVLCIKLSLRVQFTCLFGDTAQDVHIPLADAVLIFGNLVCWSINSQRLEAKIPYNRHRSQVLAETERISCGEIYY